MNTRMLKRITLVTVLALISIQVAAVEPGKLQTFSAATQTGQSALIGVDPIDFSAVDCLQVTSRSFGAVKATSPTFVVSWVADIKNICNIDFYTRANALFLDTGGNAMGSDESGDLFVPALGTAIARDSRFYSVTMFNNLVSFDVEFLENLYRPNILTVTRSLSPEQAEYEVATGIISTPLFDLSSGFVQLIFEPESLCCSSIYQLDTSNITTISDPGVEVASYSFITGILRIPILRADDGSQVVTELILKLVDSDNWKFEIESYSTETFEVQGISDQCISIDRMDSVAGLHLGDSGLPVSDVTIELTNSCAVAKHVNITYFILDGDGLQLKGINDGGVILPMTTVTFTGQTPLILPAEKSDIRQEELRLTY